MSGFKFSANRLKQSSNTEQYSSISSFNKLPNLKQISSTEYYIIYKVGKSFPVLEKNEKILSVSTAFPSIAIIITDKRILIYDYESFESRPYTLEFNNPPNQYGILTQVNLIHNPNNADKPNLVIINPITGEFSFIEAISLVPSLTVLQNKHQGQLPLHSSEFISMAEYYEEVGLLITTSQKRIICVTFKDELGNPCLNFSELLNNRPVMSFLLLKSYDLDEYEKANRIVSVYCYSENLVVKKMLVLEANGYFSICGIVNGSKCTVEKEYELETFLDPGRFEFKDVQKYGTKYLFLLSSTNFDNPKDASLSLLLMDFGSLDPKVLYRYDIAHSTNSCINPKLFLLDNSGTCLVNTGKKFILLNTDYSSSAQNWKEFILFKPEIKIYHINFKNRSDKFLKIATNEGIIFFELLKSGKLASQTDILKARIEQYLEFGSDLSPLLFSIKSIDLSISQLEINHAINSIIDDLLKNKSLLLKSLTTVEANLSRRIELMEKLADYISFNFDIDNSLKLKLVGSCELVCLSFNFFRLIHVTNLNADLEIILNDMHVNLTVNDFFLSSTQHILELITKYVEKAKNIGNVTQIIELASLLNELFVKAFIKPDYELKKKLNHIDYSATDLKIEPIFSNSLQLLVNVSEIIRMVYISSFDDSKEITEEVGEILLGLSLFLYYSSNEVVSFMSKQRRFADCKQLRNLLLKNRKKWIQIFILLRKQNEIVNLVENYDDFESLAELLDSERELAIELEQSNEISTLEFENISSNIKSRYDQYFEIFGYPFAESLFKYYINSNKINFMLTGFTENYEYLSQFLNSDIKLYKFSWIVDIKNEKYLDTSIKLLNYVSQSENETIQNKKLQLSLAKLSLISDNVSDSGFKKYINEINKNILLIDLQNHFCQCMIDSNAFNKPPDEVLKSEYLVKSNFKFFPTELRDTFKKLKSNLQPSLLDLINFFTMIELSSAFNQDVYETFFLMLKTYKPLLKSDTLILNYDSQSGDDFEVTVLRKILMRRLVLTQNWEDISRGVNLKESNLLRIISTSEQYSLRLPDSISQLLLTSKELSTIGVSNDVSFDYKLENKMLERLNKEVNWLQWLNDK